LRPTPKQKTASGDKNSERGPKGQCQIGRKPHAKNKKQAGIKKYFRFRHENKITQEQNNKSKLLSYYLVVLLF
jgi:hypothetical protein